MYVVKLELQFIIIVIVNEFISYFLWLTVLSVKSTELWKVPTCMIKLSFCDSCFLNVKTVSFSLLLCYNICPHFQIFERPNN